MFDKPTVISSPSLGAIDGIDDCTLRGWFIGAEVGGVRDNRFSVLLDDVELAVYTAELERPDVLAAEGVADAGFSVDLTNALKALPKGVHSFNDGQMHRLQLRTTAGIPVTERTLQGKLPVRGFLDRVDGAGLTGWAVNDMHPNEPVKLSIYVDDVHFMDLDTAQARGDLTSKGIAGATAGYTVTWPKGTLPKGARVDVRFLGNGASLAKSPAVIHDVVLPVLGNTSYLDHFADKRIAPVTVVVPVFNAYEAVTECLESLERHLPAWAEVLVIDDCSTDERMSELFERFGAKPRFEVHRNPENLGYTCSINLAVRRVPDRDVVLLNSDTVVTRRWLENLRYCAYARPRVATVTATSNNAGAFSVPEIAQENVVPPHLVPDEYAASIVNAGTGRILEVPTGNGFCMYIRRRAIQDVGLFDEEKYPRGYGEENDYCMRAGRAGWLNLVSDKAYVFHKRSQSFQDEKFELMASGSARLKADYPEYSMLTARFRDAEFARVRHLARTSIQRSTVESTLPRLMYVISTQTGGTPQTNMDLMRAMRGRYQCFLLRCDSRRITLSRLDGDHLEVIKTHELSVPINPVNHRSEEYDRVVLEMMYRQGITLLHIRHIGWHSMGLAAAAKSMDIPVVYSLHDFYSLCPSLNLLDQDLKYCGGACTPGEGTCQIALWPTNSFPALKHNFVHRWRQMFNEFLADCDHLITTAPSVAKTFLSVFPEKSGRLTVIPHGREFDEFPQNRRYPTPSGKVRVLVPGNISLSKGATLLKEMSELDVEGRFEFHFLGNRWTGLRDVGIDHGAYDRKDFAAKVNEISPHLGVVLSLCPETYCHTLTEMWACGIPVLGLDIGAVGDRIGANGAGWLLPVESSAQSLLDALVAAVADPNGYEQRANAVRAWQASEGLWNDTSTMAMEYRRIYKSLLTPSERELPGRIGLVVRGNLRHPATAHIRTLAPISRAVAQGYIEARNVSPTWLLAGGLEHLDAVMIQRDAVPAAMAEPLLRALREHVIPFVYEIDDLLWELPDHHGDHAIDEPARQAILSFIRHADLVTTSTPSLAERIAELNPKVVVIPNEPDRRSWLRPINPERETVAARFPVLDPARTRVLYMGTASHADDLAMIASAVNTLQELRPNVEVVQIGGGVLLPGARELQVPGECRDYPEFVRWFRSVAGSCTIGLAPLRESSFNTSKSDIKSLDYGLALLPAVYSAVAPYSHSLTDGKHGLLVANEPEAWIEAMCRLLDDASLRESIREAAYGRAYALIQASHSVRGWTSAIALVLA